MTNSSKNVRISTLNAIFVLDMSYVKHVSNSAMEVGQDDFTIPSSGHRDLYVVKVESSPKAQKTWHVN